MRMAPRDSDGAAGGSGLRDRRIVVTRDEPSDGPLSTALRSRGAIPVLRSTMTFDFADLDSPLADAISDWSRWDWLILTSARAVRGLAGVRAFDRRQPASLRVAAVGPGTASAVRAQGWGVDLAPESGGAAVLAELLRPGLGSGRRVLFPASSAAGDVIEERLSATGAELLRVTAYSPIARPQDPERWRDDLEADRLDALTFTSPSAIDALRGSLDVPLFARLLGLPAGAQGPTTASAARSAGWRTVIEADRTTFDGLAERLDHWFSP